MDICYGFLFFRKQVASTDVNQSVRPCNTLAASSIQRASNWRMSQGISERTMLRELLLCHASIAAVGLNWRQGKNGGRKKTTNTGVSIEIHTDLGVPWEEELDGTGQRTPKLHEYVMIFNEIIWENIKYHHIWPYMTNVCGKGGAQWPVVDA